MFAPAFLTGTLIARFGIAPVLLAGAILLTAGVAVAVNGITITHFWIALALNGVGWNFMYVGGSTLLTSAYTVEERAKTQAANEFLTFSIVALAQLAAGGVFAWFSWNVINYTVVPCLALAVLLTLWWYGLQRSQRFPRGA
jgi:MFS family permease